ncbi:putative oxidoreductase [Abditibacterium utsteinense]|uniref:Putative oxidoreductase n=1 Tax=Abditibacterium utsteinense TaxID=1960156 RepID=A0A2S8SSC4_9BACT|nr:aldo/keto reductase [Abditibacterium utsteinense]PQV63712.1 putative oxidoreductase [Abditibacterium utsteinense]
MNIRILGRSGLKVSEIGLGCWAIGGPSWRDGSAVGWSGNDDSQSLSGLMRAHELGINHFDTADVYGDGHSERVLGQFLKQVPRESVVIASKVGWFRGTAPNAMQPLHIRHQLEQTLLNLGTDFLDLHYFHNTNFGPEDQYLEPAAELMRDLQKEGKVRVIGQSAYSASDFLRVCPVTRPEILQFNYAAPGNADLDNPNATPDGDFFAWAQKQNLGLVMFGPLKQGLLLDKFDPENPPQRGEGDIRAGNGDFSREGLLAWREKLAPVKARFGSEVADLTRVALQYALHRSPLACVIPGFKNSSQVEVNAATAQPLSTEDFEFVRAALS